MTSLHEKLGTHMPLKMYFTYTGIKEEDADHPLHARQHEGTFVLMNGSSYCTCPATLRMDTRICFAIFELKYDSKKS
jgi:hypothetical protein